MQTASASEVRKRGPPSNSLGIFVIGHFCSFCDLGIQCLCWNVTSNSVFFSAFLGRLSLNVNYHQTHQTRTKEMAGFYLHGSLQQDWVLWNRHPPCPSPRSLEPTALKSPGIAFRTEEDYGAFFFLPLNGILFLFLCLKRFLLKYSRHAVLY